MSEISCYGCENLVDSFGNFVECIKLHRFVDWYYWHGSTAPDDCPKKEVNNDD